MGDHAGTDSCFDPIYHHHTGGSLAYLCPDTGYQKICMAASCLCTCHFRGHRKLY